MIEGVLSRRERQCLNLVGEGEGRATVARLLAVTPGTVDQYLFTACKKLGVSNVGQAVSTVRTMDRQRRLEELATALEGARDDAEEQLGLLMRYIGDEKVTAAVRRGALAVRPRDGDHPTRSTDPQSPEAKRAVLARLVPPA